MAVHKADQVGKKLLERANDALARAARPKPKHQEKQDHGRQIQHRRKTFKFLE